jgi:integrase
MIAAKEADGLSLHWIRELKTRLGRFAKSFAGPIATTSGTDLDTWLRSLNVGPRTRNNYRMCLVTLFSYAKSRRYLPRDWQEVESVTVAKKPPGPISILSVSEMETLLSSALPSLRPFLAIAAFSGLRHEEIMRLDWRDVKFSAGHIEVKAANAKTASRRLAPLPANLKRTLKPMAKESGPVATGVVSMKLRRLAEKNETKWKRNALRHSFISYRVAQTKNVNQVALEAGNSPRVIFTNYRELVTPSAARKWFKIGPSPARFGQSLQRRRAKRV